MHSKYMKLALQKAENAAEKGEVPVGAVLVSGGGEVLAGFGNEICTRSDPSAHAEMLVMRAAGAKLGNERLVGCALYVTLEPCPMCAFAMVLARIGCLVYGAGAPKTGAVEHGARVFSQSYVNHRPEIVAGVCAEESSALLKEFFRERR